MLILVFEYSSIRTNTQIFILSLILSDFSSILTNLIQHILLLIPFFVFVFIQIDFTLCSGLLFALVMVLLLFGVSCMIVGLIAGPSKVSRTILSFN